MARLQGDVNAFSAASGRTGFHERSSRVVFNAIAGDPVAGVLLVSLPHGGVVDQEQDALVGKEICPLSGTMHVVLSTFGFLLYPHRVACRNYLVRAPIFLVDGHVIGQDFKASLNGFNVAGISSFALGVVVDCGIRFDIHRLRTRFGSS